MWPAALAEGRYWESPILPVYRGPSTREQDPDTVKILKKVYWIRLQALWQSESSYSTCLRFITVKQKQPSAG